MHTSIDCLPADVRAGDLGVSWNGELPEVLAETLIDAAPHPSTCHLAVIGASHVVTVEAPAGRFREEISCHAPLQEDARFPLPESMSRENYVLQTKVSVLDSEDFEAAATEIATAGDDWLIVSFPGAGPHHLTALSAEYSHGAWQWWSHHLYPAERTIVSTRSIYQP
ncbi:DUF2617 family protein [Corynebacterium callunae]|uniref:DUF2617 domain-containing protein n=1 Tax=Corynebacterium callunae DSM 20147 TaxID=1121353 RepID=M1UVU9_9CORY|nr:DUF2617 family protein [Corynebacterium callunae]AGG67697.1 hypothetical protein H924_11345 [Corynebacterium callunae DSM 20147]MCK2200022.1 DUF2617 family protein [Corynebacterium callunae]